MNRPMLHHLAPGLALLLLAVVLFIPALIAAQEDAPPIPHQLERRADCLGCHASGKLKSPKIPDNDTHADVPSEACMDCHQPGDAAALAAGDDSGAAPAVPHQLERREDCLNCHATGKLKSPKIPDNDTHVDVTNGDCLGCHPSAPAIPHTMEGREDCTRCHLEGGEMAAAADSAAEAAPAEPTPSPTPTPEPIPTPVVYPKVKGVNTCFTCHAALEDEALVEISTHWERSIHNESQVACVDCHGGNSAAETKEAAKAADTGYIGIPAKAEIPGLCASCHADVVQMRQYNLPTDQFAKYKESVHGLRLAEGDDAVATCYDCHGGHLVLKANDPASSVYPSAVPATCAACHADAQHMAPYQIPTNQLNLYQDSVHGEALLVEQDFRAPNCATCHGTHGATPPGFEEVANVCGSCHSATQNHYVASPHSADDDLAPKCVNCHGRHDVTKPSEALYLGEDEKHCGECHSEDSEPGRVAETMYGNLTSADESYEAAEVAIEEARAVGMLVSPMEGRLRAANTNLITARAMQHTLDVDAVGELTDEAVVIAAEVKASAEDAVAQNVFRRRAMVIAVAAIALIIVALFMLKRELDAKMAEEEA